MTVVTLSHISHCKNAIFCNVVTFLEVPYAFHVPPSRPLVLTHLVTAAPTPGRGIAAALAMASGAWLLSIDCMPLADGFPIPENTSLWAPLLLRVVSQKHIEMECLGAGILPVAGLAHLAGLFQGLPKAWLRINGFRRPSSSCRWPPKHPPGLPWSSPGSRSGPLPLCRLSSALPDALIEMSTDE
jgi:hypothetical protein